MVKEDLIDEIAKESGPYQPPEKIMRRSDMATDFSTPQQRTIKPNEWVEGHDNMLRLPIPLAFFVCVSQGGQGSGCYPAVYLGSVETTVEGAQGK